jgi:hypothetical protein
VTQFDIPPLHVCCCAGFALPSPGAPLGYTIYSFRHSLKQTFLHRLQLVCNVFDGALVVSEVYDFLNGHRVFAYGRLAFGQNSVFIVNQAFHFEDAVARYPFLLCHCITPHVPADPCFFVQVYPEDPVLYMSA